MISLTIKILWRVSPFAKYASSAIDPAVSGNISMQSDILATKLSNSAIRTKFSLFLVYSSAHFLFDISLVFVEGIH